MACLSLIVLAVVVVVFRGAVRVFPRAAVTARRARVSKTPPPALGWTRRVRERRKILLVGGLLLTRCLQQPKRRRSLSPST